MKLPIVLAALLALPIGARAQTYLNRLPVAAPALTDVIPFTQGYTESGTGHTKNMTVGSLLSTPGSTQYMPFAGGSFTGPVALPNPTINGGTLSGTFSGNATLNLGTGAITARNLPLNVVTFGAAMNGTTDDSTAFNNARIAAGTYTPIFVPPGGFDVPTAPTGGTTNPLLWELSGNSYGTSNNQPVLSMGNADTVQTFFSGTSFLGRENSPANANPLFRLDINQNGVGGSNGWVVPGFQVNATQGVGSVSSVWAIQANLTSNAANNGSNWPEPVALQASVTKTASAPLWGSQINLTDSQNADTATAGGMFGLEIGYNASGTDSADSRRLIDLVFAPDASNPAGVIGTGIYMRGLSGETITRGLRMSGNFTTGIDLSGATLGTDAYNDGHFQLSAAGELLQSKIADPNTAPGAGEMKMTVEAGTAAGTCKIVARAGTSATPVTIVDNVGAGC